MKNSKTVTKKAKKRIFWTRDCPRESYIHSTIEEASRGLCPQCKGVIKLKEVETIKCEFRLGEK